MPKTLKRFRANVEIKNKIHAILLRHGIDAIYSDNFGKKGIEYMRTLALPMTDRFELDSYLDILENINKQIDDTTERVEEFVEHHPHARLIMSMPGIGFYSALMICAEIGDITRFPERKKLACFAGLNPSVYQSGNKCRTGHIAKQGDRNLRWILIQCANVAVRHDKYMAQIYHHFKEKKRHRPRAPPAFYA